ncbi:helix-turn-helix domain-containing protein [Filobacillus milosensis]|uniref:helix-turn-helix domain-containing protein n=1 Tax=Filobacillus milosensis TaxID=94137 RepID=UPI001891636B|nr:helix-turn-helix transcriptional regulator [Filobacillus milosensis]
MDTREEIGKRIYELRRYFKITQKELCEGICTQAYISKIENGSLAIAADILFQIAERLGVDINYFYDSTYNSRVDYALEVELEARELVKNDDYEMLRELIKREERTPLMNNNKFKQFILWHKSLCKRFLDENHYEALELLEEALKLCNTSTKSYSEREIQILINKANLFIDISEIRSFEKAIVIYKDAKVAIESLPYIHDNDLLTLILYNLARAYTLEHKPEEAIKYAEEGIINCQKTNSLFGFGQLHFILGVNHKELKKYSIALEHLEKAKVISNLSNNFGSMPIIEKNIKKIRDLFNYEKV